MTHSRSFRRATALGALLLALTALAYWPGLTGSFLFDDYPQIVHQDAIHMESFDTASVLGALRGFSHGIGRPIPMLSFALDHLAWGRAPFGYKLSSLVVHLANALLVYLLAMRLLSLAAGPGKAGQEPAAAIIASAWAMHPLQVSTVLYVVQRMETLSLAFVLLALLAYLSGRTRQMRGLRAWPRLAGALALALVGLACKETAALFPVYALILEFTVLGFRAKSPGTEVNWRRAYAAAVISGIAVVAVLLPGYADPAVFAIRDYSALERVLTQFRVLPMYLGWIVLPDPGAYVFYYDQYTPSRGLLEPAGTLAGLLFLLGLAGSALWWRRSIPLYSLGVLWFLAAHAITSSFLPLELVFEHRNYFAILGVVLAAYALCAKAWQQRAARQPPLALGMLVVAGLAGLTLMRSSTWGDPLHLAMDLAQRNPGSARAGTGLGDQYLLMASDAPGDPFVGLARDEYERAAALPGASPIPEQALIIMAARLGQPASDDWWRGIIRKLSSQPIGPQEMSVVTSLLDLRNEGLPIDDRGLADAYMVLSRRMSLPAPQYFAFAMHALVDLGDTSLAAELLGQVVESARGDDAMLLEFSRYLQEQGFTEQARSLLSGNRPTPGKSNE